jgi:hypothetical protein
MASDRRQVERLRRLQHVVPRVIDLRALDRRRAGLGRQRVGLGRGLAGRLRDGLLHRRLGPDGLGRSAGRRRLEHRQV